MISTSELLQIFDKENLDVLDEIWDWTESVSENFPTHSWNCFSSNQRSNIFQQKQRFIQQSTTSNANYSLLFFL